MYVEMQKKQRGKRLLSPKKRLFSLMLYRVKKSEKSHLEKETKYDFD